MKLPEMIEQLPPAEQKQFASLQEIFDKATQNRGLDFDVTLEDMNDILNHIIQVHETEDIPKENAVLFDKPEQGQGRRVKSMVAEIEEKLQQQALKRDEESLQRGKGKRRNRGNGEESTRSGSNKRTSY